MTWASVSSLGYVQDQALQIKGKLLSASEVALASLYRKQPPFLNSSVFYIRLARQSLALVGRRTAARRTSIAFQPPEERACSRLRFALTRRLERRAKLRLERPLKRRVF
jgi:hypothetical protein